MFAFVDVDDGRAVAPDFDVIRPWLANVLERLGTPVTDFPEPMRHHLNLALDLYALAAEQHNLGRGRLFQALTDQATMSASLALELTLKMRMPREDGASEDKRTLGKLLHQARDEDIIVDSEFMKPIWDTVLTHRNQHAHGHDDADHYGTLAFAYVQTVVALTAGLLGMGPDRDAGQ